MFESDIIIFVAIVGYILIGIYLVFVYTQVVAKYRLQKSAGIFDNYSRLLYRRVMLRFLLKTYACMLLVAPLSGFPIAVLILAPLYFIFAMILYQFSREWKERRYSTEILLLSIMVVIALHFAIGLAARNIIL